MTPLSQRGRLALTLLVALRLSLDTSRFLADPAHYWNWEDSYNAAVGWYVAYAGMWDQALNLQYKAFCGGCTVEALVAAPLFAIGGDHQVLWKAVALLYTAATMLTGFVALSAHAGRRAGWAFAVLFAAPPLGSTDIALMLWGNHNESMLYVFAGFALIATGRAFPGGLVLGLGAWACRTTLFAPLALVPLALSLPGPRWRVLVGLALGLGLLAIPAAAGDNGTYHMDLASNLLPEGPGAAWQRLLVLVSPEEIGRRFFGGRPGNTGVAAAWLGAAALALVLVLSDSARGRRRLTVPALAAGFAVLYSISGFPLPRAVGDTVVMSLRYHAPWMMVLAALVASACGSSGWRGRTAMAGLAVMLVASGRSQLEAVGGAWGKHATARDAWAISVLHPVEFAGPALGRLTGERLARASSRDPETEASLRRMEGYRAGRDARGFDAATALSLAALSPAAAEGYGQVMADPMPGWPRLPELNQQLATLPPPVAVDLGHGAAYNLLFGVRGEPPPGQGPKVRPSKAAAPEAAARQTIKLVARAQEGAPAGTCWTCRAVGPALVEACSGAHRRTDPPAAEVGACMATALPSVPFAAEVAYGAGLTCARPGATKARCEAVAAALPAPYSAAFLAGVADPVAGAERPLTFRQEPGPPSK